MFFSSEQRDNARFFDKLISDVRTALGNSYVIEELGGETCKELLINANYTFLPNIRHGKPSIPRNHKNDANTVVFPVTDHQADIALDLILPLQDCYVCTQSTSDALNSDFYGLYGLEKEVQEAFLRGYCLGSANDPTIRGLRKTTLAGIRFCTGTSVDGSTYLTGRPTIIVRKSLDPRYYAMVLAHELVHVADTVRDGVICMALPHQAASEFRAYHASEAIATAYDTLKTSVGQMSLRVGQLRKSTLGQSKYPYKPSSEQIESLAEMSAM